jgi:hypothetical protein
LHSPLEIATILLALLVAVVPKKKTVRRLAALSAALIVAFELVLLYWFYAYIIWFEPFDFVALLLANNEKTALDGVRSDRQAVVGYPKEVNGELTISREEK